jgi:hypothetical protein
MSSPQITTIFGFSLLLSAGAASASDAGKSDPAATTELANAPFAHLGTLKLRLFFLTFFILSPLLSFFDMFFTVNFNCSFLPPFFYLTGALFS